ncbi:MAG TPA: DNA repair protein RecO [Pyrinomonadaceae bacterium]|nr:DNA repair protein RecO [Pyrinomonadaceae bacterium]
MYLTNSEAIILRTHKLSEADKIVVFLSRKSGVVRGVARGARRLKSRFGAGLEPFTKVYISWAEKEARELVSIRQVEIEKSYFDLSRNPEAVSALEQMCASTLTFAPPSQPDERLFRMVAACVDALGERPEESEAVLIYFELWLLQLSGFLPDLSTCGACRVDLGAGAGRVSARPDGVLLCGSCAGEGDEPLGREVFQSLAASRRHGPRRWAEHFLLRDQAVRRETAKYSRRLLSRVTGQQPRAAG